MILPSELIGCWTCPARGGSNRGSTHRIFGYSSPLRHWTFETFLAHVDVDDRAGVSESFQRAKMSGDDWRVECRIIRSDGVPRWIALHGRAERSGRGMPVRILGVVLDITERRELLDRGQKARAEADRASRAKDEFLAMLGHELRNPLAPIQPPCG